MSTKGVNSPNFRHGMGRTKFYMLWADMKKRCDNSKSTNYKYYGGRGIRYETSWSLFVNFMKDMLPSYTEGLSLDRMNIDGDYSKENCRWVEWGDQARNHRKRVDNSSGITGVHRSSSFNKSGKEYFRWSATWTDVSGVVKSRAFSVNKYGEDGAFNMACEYRSNMIESLMQYGIYYGEGHGL